MNDLLRFIKFELLDQKSRITQARYKIPKDKRTPIIIRILKLEEAIKLIDMLLSTNKWFKKSLPKKKVRSNL